jgi:RecA-family ATPase
MLVNNLIPEDGITLLHGQPRDRKSLAMQEVVLAIVTGTPAFGLERLTTPQPLPVLYINEEDPERRVLERFKGLTAARRITKLPDNLFLSVRRGVDLDDFNWQDRLITNARRFGIKFVVLDPLRALTARSDQGPSDLKPFADFARKLVREIPCAIGLFITTPSLARGKQTIEIGHTVRAVEAFLQSPMLPFTLSGMISGAPYSFQPATSSPKTLARCFSRSKNAETLSSGFS